MVDMGMGEQDRIERLGVEAQISVLPIGFVSASLKQPTIQQELKPGTSSIWRLPVTERAAPWNESFMMKALHCGG